MASGEWERELEADMREFCAVELIGGRESLREKGIEPGASGVLIAPVAGTESWIAVFFNPACEGDYAVTVVEERELKLLGRLPDEAVTEWKAIAERPEFFGHTAFIKLKFKEYDRVELVRDRPEYAREGVTRGMRGCVMGAAAVRGRRQVIFSEENIGRDIAELSVAEADLAPAER